MVGVRMAEDFQSSIRAWASQQDDQPALAEAIRRLVEIGLAHAPRPKTSRSRAAAKAKEMAEETVDRLMTEDTAPEERAVRKQRLIEGPQSLREVRKKTSK